MANMFYEGSLQEGISTAVGQQKLVLCFVTDNNEESQSWENDFLPDESIAGLLKNQSVALRLTAGSEEAGYLSQIFPLPQTPTVVIIKNGELKEYITPGVSKEDFIRRIQTAFSAPVATQSSPSQPPSTPPQAAQNDSQQSPVPAEADTSENVRRILAERAARLQAEKEETERRAKEERAKAKERAKAEAEAGAKTDAARKYKQAEMLKKKKQQDEEERQRILKRIEDDKVERRELAAERERQRTDSLRAEDQGPGSPSTKLPSTTRVSEKTALQFRLFDGSTIRSHFLTKSTLQQVREWVDENRNDGNLPYTFKQVLTPMPNKNIDPTEESQDLRALGLAPSSTMVLIPVPKYTSAYDGGSGNILTRVIRLVLGFFTWLLSLIGLGGSRPLPQEDSSPSTGSDTTPERSRVRGFQNPDDRRRDQQLYNGNSLNFEPRPDEEEK